MSRVHTEALGPTEKSVTVMLKVVQPEKRIEVCSVVMFVFVGDTRPVGLTTKVLVVVTESYPSVVTMVRYSV